MRIVSSVTTSFGEPTAYMTPGGAMTAISSAKRVAMLRSWLIMTMEIPVLWASSLRIMVTWIWCFASRLAVGSSRRRYRGVWARPRAMTIL